MGVEFADAMNIILALMPGIMVTYNGEELGMEDTFIRWDQTVDPSGLLLGKDHYLSGTRDPERTPMQWDTSENSGKAFERWFSFCSVRMLDFSENKKTNVTCAKL